MNTVRSIFVGALLLTCPAEAQEHRFEADPIVVVRENFVACDVLSQLQRVMDNPRFLLSGECEPLRAGDQVRIYARRGPYFCIYPRDRTSPCKWTLDAGYQSYVVMDASGAFSLAEREAGIARMVQRGVILTDYFAITVEMMRSNADPRSNEVYAALDMDFAVLVGQISKADAAKAQKSSRSVAA